jgi:hypothetical protein
MPKLSDENNSAPLTADLSMYYKGTYICRHVKDDLQVMYVQGVEAKGDDTKLTGVIFFGYVRTKDGEKDGRVSWSAEEVLFFVPPSGFYKFYSGPKYVSYIVENRSQKKGLNPNRVLFNGIRAEINLKTAYSLFNHSHFEGKFSNDLAVIKGDIQWKTLKVGKLHDGAVTITKQYEHLQELICKLLARSLEIKTVTLQ